MSAWLHPYELVLHVMEETYPDVHRCQGELHIQITDDSAWVQPCDRLIITEDILDKLAEFLRPLGVRWMRGWHSGMWQGRVIAPFDDGSPSQLGVQHDAAGLDSSANDGGDGPDASGDGPGLAGPAAGDDAGR